MTFEEWYEQTARGSRGLTRSTRLTHGPAGWLVVYDCTTWTGRTRDDEGRLAQFARWLWLLLLGGRR